MNKSRTRGLFLIFLMTLLTACGGGGSSNGGGPASTMTVTLATGTTTYTEGHINNIGYYDPSFSGDCDPLAGTLITMCSGVTYTMSHTTCDVLINVRTSDMTPGPYSITGNSSADTYVLYHNKTQFYDSFVSSGTITLTSVGSVGAPITGSFQAVLQLLSAPTTTMGISGTFSVIRDH